jgi:predicted nucleic acid-binding Zn finger protein
MTSKKQLIEGQIFTPAEQRAAKAERVKVSEAEPYGWIAESESSKEFYILYASPYTKRLVCTCADFIYRGKDESNYECKHVSAVLKFIGRWYLVNDYDPLRQICKAG